MILCEVALGKMKEVGFDPKDDDDNDDDDNTTELNLKKFQSRKALGQNIPDPRYTITRNYGLSSSQTSSIYFISTFSGVRMPLGQLIPNPDIKYPYRHLNYNEYIVYDESQVALRYLVQFRR